MLRIHSMGMISSQLPQAQVPIPKQDKPAKSGSLSFADVLANVQAKSK